MPRPLTPLITRRAVVTAALEIIDEKGQGALSIRRLAASMGVTGASLYYHYRDKGEILDDVARHVLGANKPLPEPVLDWKTYFIAAHGAYRKAVAAHPNVAPILLERRPRRFGVAVYEQAARVLTEAGVPAKYVWSIIDHLEAMALGSILLAMPIKSVTSQFGEVGDELPALRNILKSSEELSETEEFDLGARLLIDGVEHRFMRGSKDSSTPSL